jgi:hypothetical protein
METNGEYMAASSTVGGGRYASPPPLALCQLPFTYSAMVVAGKAQRGGCGGIATGESDEGLPRIKLRAHYGGRDWRMVAAREPHEYQ